VTVSLCLPAGISLFAHFCHFLPLLLFLSCFRRARL
jgi:hypothetical protein